VSIDVEDYFQIEAAYQAVGPDRWNDWPSRVERNVDLLLELFARRGQHGTFFILGSVAKRFPHIPKQIADAGHEVGSHGTMHDRLHRLNADTFRADLAESRKVLQDTSGQEVIGYRAPTFSVTRATRWAVDVLREEGFVYDSSVFPVVHPAYGVPDAPNRPYWLKADSSDDASAEAPATNDEAASLGAPGDADRLLEIPPLTWRTLGRNVAVAGGGYFRLLPLWFMKRGLAQAALERRPAVLYFHPWEFDPDMPRLPLGRVGRIRTYTGLASAESKLEHIMTQPGDWRPIRDCLDDYRRIAHDTGEYTLTGAA